MVCCALLFTPPRVNRSLTLVPPLSYKNCGDVALLPDIVALAEAYTFRIIVDESLSWGVLGDHGRGVTEHFNMPGMTLGVEAMPPS